MSEGRASNGQFLKGFRAPARMADCICRECCKLFQYNAAAVAKGRGQFCSRKCGARNGQRQRWAVAKQTARQRYEALVIRRGPDECWGWKGFKHQGYGRMGNVFGRGSIGAHRVSYILHSGVIPGDLIVMHKCDNRECTNPRHLTLGTIADNNRDRDIKGRAAKGASAGRASIDEKTVLAMRSMFRRGGVTKTEVADAFRVNRNTASSVLLGRTWRHLL